MRSHLATVVGALTTRKNGGYNGGPLADCLKELRDATGLELDEPPCAWAQQRRKKTDLSPMWTHFGAALCEQQHTWLQARCIEATLIMAQLDKARALVTTLRTAKSKALERQETPTAACHA